MTERSQRTPENQRGSSAGPYMLTLCALAAPVSVRFPDASPLRQFKFFMSRAREEENVPPLRLHMGYFESLAEAERWALALRAKYPGAVAMRVPQILLEQPGSGVPVLRAASSVLSAATAPPAPSDPVQASPDCRTLTDTQVMRILDGRRDSQTQPGGEERHAGIALVGPDDSQTRRALKEAVSQGSAVSFAVQLLWSAADIDLTTVPSLSIFRAYTLYKTATTREGRSWYCLRLGFFRDAISAKQVAYYVQKHFASVAVVPVTEAEQAQSAECRVNPTDLSDDFQRSIDEALARDRSSAEARPAGSPARPSPETKPARPQSPPRKAKDGLEQTLEMLAASEMWSDPDSHAETGVRHLKFEIRKTSSG